MLCVFGIIVIGCIFVLNTSKKSLINNYTMNIDANIDGSVNVKEVKDYDFVDKDNVIVLGFNVVEKDSILGKYNVASFKNNINYFHIKVQQNGKVKEITYQKGKVNSPENLYALDNVTILPNNMFGVKVDDYFSKGTVHVTFEYNLEKCVVKYTDKSQVYLKLSNVANIFDITNMTVNLNLYNKEKNSNVDLYKYNKNDISVSKVSSQNVTLNYNNIQAGSNVQSRILYDSNSSSSSRLPYENGNILNKLQEDTNKYNNLSKIDGLLQKGTIGFGILLFIYWIYLLMKYDFNKLDSSSFPSYDEVVDTLNPIIAACIIDERTLEHKDLIACLIGLSAKKVIDIKTLPRQLYDEKLKISDDKNDERMQEYIQELKDKDIVFVFNKNKEFWKDSKKVESLDDIDRQVIELFFDNKDEFILDLRLYEIKSDLSSGLKIDGIKIGVEQELENLGANVPIKPSIKLVNKIIFGLTILFVIFQIVFNIYYTNVTNTILSDYSFGFTGMMTNIFGYLELIDKSLLIIAVVSIFLEVIIYFSYVIILFLDKTTKATLQYIKEGNPNFNAKIYMNSISKVTKMAGKIFAICILVSIVIFLIIPTYKVFIYLLPLIFAIILIVTDDYMYKHSDKLSKLYLGINILQNKIGYGSLLKEKNLKDSIVWNKYLAFSLAFGISNISDYTNILKNNVDTFSEVNEFVTDKQVYVDLLESFLKRGAETADSEITMDFFNL